MRRVGFAVLLLIVGLSAIGSANAFDNIEADAAYNGTIKEKIEAEFRQGLKLLRSQADSLKMDVREQDLVALKHHIYDKALLMGACVDQGLTIQKTLNKKVTLEKFIPGCVSTHLRFEQEQRERDFINRNIASATRANDLNYVDNIKNERCLLDATRNKAMPNPAYEFLGIESGYSPMDYITGKRCYDATRSPNFSGIK